MAEYYQWESGEGAHWEIDFVTNDINLVYE